MDSRIRRSVVETAIVSSIKPQTVYRETVSVVSDFLSLVYSSDILRSSRPRIG